MSFLVVLCEGDTEKAFVNSVLREYLLSFGFYDVRPVLLGKTVKHDVATAPGGVLKYDPVYRQIAAALRQNKTIFVTMMTDLYAFPRDFPNYEELAQIAKPYERVTALETAIRNQVNSERFIPYIQLHEFEALTLSSKEHFKKAFDTNRHKSVDNLFREIQGLAPEEVNQTVEGAPSKRILSHLTGYNKVRMGASITKSIGVEALKASCPHFGEWIERLCRLPSVSV
ncbi:MAG: DUF4276 family protein [Armatimonadetes bacterium]|nr:DUF4276 family protein [Armatimonadota bacterium]